jgi:hypothetical protein
MNDPTERRQVDMNAVMHAVGQINGSIQEMHRGLCLRVDDIKADIRRMEEAQSARINRVEENLGRQIENLETRVGQRIDALGERVTALEVEDKKLIEKTARLSALSGGVGGALAAAAVEIIKRMG